MGIVVIEGGSPNGTDLVMGDHHSNGVARAKAADQPIIRVVDLGDDFAVAGCRLEIAWDEGKENLCVLLVMDAGKNSRLVGLQVVPTLIAELGRIPVADLKAGITKAMTPMVSV
jgi:L-arabinose isomerase